MSIWAFNFYAVVFAYFNDFHCKNYGNYTSTTHTLCSYVYQYPPYNNIVNAYIEWMADGRKLRTIGHDGMIKQLTSLFILEIVWLREPVIN